MFNKKSLGMRPGKFGKIEDYACAWYTKIRLSSNQKIEMSFANAATIIINGIVLVVLLIGKLRKIKNFWALVDLIFELIIVAMQGLLKQFPWIRPEYYVIDRKVIPINYYSSH